MWLTCACLWLLPASSTLAAAAPNIVFILCDDHRFDCLGAAGHPFLETPHLDALAARGVRCTRAYVTTSLCSPSRASILTGQYAHRHGVIDNYHPVDPALTFFPQLLQQAGYETAFFGKWHMGGEIDDPQRGFDHWVAFKGQGTYWADGHGTTREVPQTTYDGFNINGVRVPQRGYITDELTDLALGWLDQRSGERPFFVYVSHKAVHSDFVPADRHRGRYANQPLPVSVPTLAELDAGALPMWVRNQRNSRHGAEFGYNLAEFDLAAYYRRYCETLLAVDDSVGRVTQWLERTGQLQNTVIVYMGDNGFQFGEHGLIDKRTPYEVSAKVPLLISAPGRIPAGQITDLLVANLDIGPTLLAAAGAPPLSTADGHSVWTQLCALGGPADAVKPAQDGLLYEYYWERNYPQTPTLHAVIGQRWKYIRAHGIWDRDELYDLETDPEELHNLIHDATHAETLQGLQQQLWSLLSESHGETIPFHPDRGATFPWRHADQSAPAEFPPEWLRHD